MFGKQMDEGKRWAGAARDTLSFSPKGQWGNIFLNKMSNNKEVSFFPFSSSFIVKSLRLVSWGNTIKSPLSRFHSQGKVLTSSNSQKKTWNVRKTRWKEHKLTKEVHQQILRKWGECRRRWRTIQRTLHLETFEAEQLWTSLQMTVKHVEKNTNLIKNFLQQQLKD